MQRVTPVGMAAIEDLRLYLKGRLFHTILADPPWQFHNRTGKIAPEHKRLTRYDTMQLTDILALPVDEHLEEMAHLYLGSPQKE
ncbi:hypothetical protein [Candidatus Magnetaquicoccus inordinatus]|uniref:hypothetical protein n=1 Tax=Candidatus Magnetaquicoccus inordinatus TaxID=2496818 RepID=UPI00187D0CED|nr:hypothetical protein [Candidatus Magnetaquicoccus inordinatus]